MIINLLKLEVYDTFRKDETIRTDFQHINNEEVLNKSYLDEKILKKDGQISFLEKDCNEFILQYNKKSVEEILFQEL